MGLNTINGESSPGNFAALRHVTRLMEQTQHAAGSRSKIGPPVLPATDAAAGVAEGPGLAHDAGNLLGALSLYSDLLAMPGVLNEQHKEYASELRMLSDRSWAMIDRLVNHTRAGRTDSGAASAVLPDVIDRCRGLLSRIAGRRVEISYGIGAFDPVPAPVESVERILTNLAKNAAEATPWVGAISIHVEGVLELHGGIERRRVSMSVHDRGCGMDRATVRRLMQSGPGSSSNGRGIGFRVVRELVAISGGCLHIESQQDVGTSVTVEWYGIKDTEDGTPAGHPAQMRQVMQREAGWMAY